MRAPRLATFQWSSSKNIHQPSKYRERQVDFANRSLLFRLILERKFEDAATRVEEAPEEAAVWIIEEESPCVVAANQLPRRRRRRESWPPPTKVWLDDNHNHGDECFRQLPLHLACNLLSPESDGQQLELESLISELVSVYPEACRRRDGQGRLPLHRILECRPSIGLVVHMVVAHPDAVRDESCKDLLASSPPHDSYATRVQQVLQQAEQALLHSRQDTALWFLLGVQGLGPKENASGLVTDAASLLESSHIQVNMQQQLSASETTDNDSYGFPQSIEPLLKSLMARNDAYADVLLALSQERFNNSETSQLSMDMQQPTNSEEEIYALQDENGYLKKRIFGLEMTLRDLGYNNKNDDDFSPHLETGETMSVMGMDPERPSALAKYMETKVTELQEELDGLENENERLVAQIEELQSHVNNLQRKSSEVDFEDGHSVRSKLLSASSSDDRNDVRVSAPVMQDTPASTPTSSDNGSGHDLDPVSDDVGDNDATRVASISKDASSGEKERVVSLEENKGLEAQNRALKKRVMELESARETHHEHSDADGSVEASSSKTIRLTEENQRLESQKLILAQKVLELEKSLEDITRARESSADGAESLSATIDSLSAAVESHSAEVAYLHKQLEKVSNEAVRKEDALDAEISRLRQELAYTQNENRTLLDHGIEDPDGWRSESASSKDETSTDSRSHNQSERSAPLGERLKAIDRLSGHPDNDNVECDDVSCSTPSSEPSVAASLALSSTINSPHSLHGSEKFGSKASSSFTRSYNNSLSSGKTVSNRSTSSWAVLSATQQSGKRKGRRPRKLKSLVKVLPRDSDLIESFHTSLPDLAASFFRDDLGSMLKTAAELYHDFGEQNRGILTTEIETREAILASKGDSVTQSSTKAKLKRRYSDGGASPLASLQQGTLSESDRNDNLEQTAILLTFEDDMLFIIGRAEEILHQELADDLVNALQESCFHQLNDSALPASRHSIPEGIIDSSIIEQVEAVYGNTVPEPVLSALCEASRELIETSNNEILAMERMKDRLEQEFLDALIDTAESRMSLPLPVDIVASLRTAAASFGQLLEENEDESKNDYTIQVDFHRLDVLLKQAEELYGRQFPENILVVLREASFVLQARLDGTDLVGSVWDLKSTGDIDKSEPVPGHHSEVSLGAHQTTQAGARQHSVTNESSSAWSEPLQGRDSFSVPGTPGNDDGPGEMEQGGDSCGDDTDDIKSYGTMSRASDDASMDIVAVFNQKQPLESQEMLNDNRGDIGSGSSSENISSLSRERSEGSKWAEDGTPAYVPPSQRGRSPRRKVAPRRGSDAEPESTAKRTVAEMRRSRSADSKFGNMSRSRFGSDNLNEIFERATKEVGSLSGPSSGFSMSSSGSFVSVSSFRYGGGDAEQESLDSILDTLLSDTEETYGIEISESVITAIKNAVKLSVDKASLIPVVRALHDDDVIAQASRFNEKEIPGDLVEAIRLTSLPPGVSAESLLTINDSRTNRGKNQRPNVNSARSIPPPLPQGAKESSKRIDQTSHQNLGPNDGENSWHKLSTSPAIAASRKVSKTEEQEVVKTVNIRVAARERKRKAEQKLGNSLADFGGTAEELQDLVTHAREALGMHPTAIGDKSENDGSMTITSELTESLRYEGRRLVTGGSLTVIRPIKSESCIAASPQDLELDVLLAKIEEDPSFKPDFDFDVALRRASRSIDETLDSIAPAKELPGIVYGTYLPWWRLEIILGEAEVFLGKEISAATLSKIIDAASRLTMQESDGAKQDQHLQTQALPSSADDPKSPTSKHMREIDNLSQIYRTAYPSSPRPDLSDQPLPTLSPPEPPNFTALAAERSTNRKSLDPNATRPSHLPAFSDSFVSLVADDEDDLSKLYRNAYAEAKRTKNIDGPVSFTERSPPNPSFESLKPGNRALSLSDLKAPPVERRTPILSKFLELNRRELLERTQSGREIPMVSPVTEPTMDSGSLLAERFLALAQTIPDLDGTLEAETVENSEKGDTTRGPKTDDSGEAPRVSSGKGSRVEGSSKDSRIDSSRESLADSRLSRLDDASFDTYRELEAILLETKEEFGTELSMDLVAAVKKAASSEIDPDSLHDSASLLMEHIALQSTETDESTLHGIAVELSRKLSLSAASETSHSLSDFVLGLRSKLTESRQAEKQNVPTVWASKHYLDNLVNVASKEMGRELPGEIAERIRGSSVQANTRQNPPVGWDQLEMLLQQVCEGYDEDTWFEVQEAFFKAWESFSTPDLSRQVPRKTSKWGHASGYISAVSESSVSALMDDHDFDHQDIFLEMKRIYPEVLDRVKLENSTTSSMSEFEYSKDFGESATSGLLRGLGDSESASASLEYSQSVQHDQSQSSFSCSSASPNSNKTSPYGSRSAVHLEAGEVERLGLIREEDRSESQTSSSVSREIEVSQTSSESHDQQSPLQRAGSKCNSTVSSLSSSVHSQGSEGEYSVELNSGESDTIRTSTGSVKSAAQSTRSAPSTTKPATRPPIERTHSTHSIQSAHSVTVNRTLGPDILKELQKKYAGDLPDELVFVLKNSILIPYSMNSDEDLSIILRECGSLSQTNLAADLVLAVREASVSVRNQSTSSRSRRGRLTKQHSGSFRSTSRSSGMPSISETGYGGTNPDNDNTANSPPAEIKTSTSINSPFKPARTISRRDSADPGIPMPSLESQVVFGSIDSMNRSGHSARSAHSFVSESDESISLKSLHDESNSARLPDQVSPGTRFNQSDNTQLVSNTGREARRLGRDLQMEMGTIHSLSTSMASTIEDQDNDFDSVHSDHTTKSSNRSLQPSTSASSMGYQLGMSSCHSSRQTDGGKGERSHSTSNISAVSRTSTLASKRLPLGVNVAPPVAGVESDDLAEIFAVAARRMSRLVEGKLSAEIDRRPDSERRNST